jgi:hypothetical protein
MSWVCWKPETDTPWVDVMPDNDLVVHEFGEACICGPEVEYRDPGTGDYYHAPMYSHHSLDRREERE